MSQAPTTGPERTSGRRTFGPVVLLGLGSAGLAAVASAKPWYGGTSTAGGEASMSLSETGARYPLASAVSLVLLAAWGVLLVTRGRVRRAFAVVAALAAMALVVSVVAAYVTLPDTAADDFERLMGRGQSDPGFTGWFWTAAVAAVVSVVPAVLAVRLAPTWPEMGSRYDAPQSGPAPEVEPTSDRDLWDQLDDGRDPTDPHPHH